MFIILWDVKELTHLSQRVGHVVPGVVVCLLWFVMVGRVNARKYKLHQATLKSEGKERKKERKKQDTVSHPVKA